MKKSLTFIDARTRRTIALLIIGIYLVMALTAAFYPIFHKESSGQSTDVKDFADYFSKISGGLPTIIGVIIGYYFAKNEGKGTSENGNDSTRSPEPPTPTPPIVTPSPDVVGPGPSGVMPVAPPAAP